MCGFVWEFGGVWDFVWMRVYMCVCMYLCTCVNVCIYVYVCTRASLPIYPCPFCLCMCKYAPQTQKLASVRLNPIKARKIHHSDTREQKAIELVQFDLWVAATRKKATWIPMKILICYFSDFFRYYYHHYIFKALLEQVRISERLFCL